MTAAAVRRLREIAAERRRLDDEEEQLLARLADDDTLDGAPVSDTVVTEILTGEHVTVAKLAEKLRVSEKTARGIGNAAGARIQIGGRVLFDIAIVRRHVSSANYRVLPSSSVSNGAQIAENANDDEREQS